MNVWKSKNIELINEDFLKVDLRENSVDLIITSPPYNIGIDYGKYDDNKTYKEYIEFSKNWLQKSYKLLKNEGRICINVPIDTGRNGKRSIASDITILAKNAGFKYKGTIVWNKQSVKNKYAMVFSANLEVILVLYKRDWKPVKKEFKEWVNEIWKFSGESAKRVGHPAPFPVEIPRRLIKMFSETGDVVLDPFVGSGTTLVACKQASRNGVGVEVDEKYFELAKK
ncbi:MAG TPA: site-specific DNA-methyltransferase [Candidatus Saccharimonadales bacterium]|nr:site-specific DNA-methyltransferase [Candidatus Saccharimonadales bacterium]